MWTIFKLLNLISIFASAYIWITARMPKTMLMLFLDLAMIGCLSFIPTRFRMDGKTGMILFTFIILIIWTTINESPGMALNMIISYLPVFFLVALPRGYQTDLLTFVTKWVSISLIPSLIIYWLTFFIPLPSLGTFNFPPYEPFTNYLFFIKTTFDFGTLVRFNAFFPEPGHLAMVCVFLMMANRFDFKNNPWIWVLLVAVVFSFSLAGYILTLLGFMLLKINSIAKGITLSLLLVGIVIGALNFSGGNNAVNQLILERLKYDESKGIQGNNRFFNNTEFEYQKASKSGDYWVGVSKKANMTLVSGAGFKIYVLWHGLIGVFLILAFYLSMIPPHPNWHYTLSFLIIVILCFMQNAYPDWYAWIFPYVLGLNLHGKRDSTENDNLSEDPTLLSYP